MEKTKVKIRIAGSDITIITDDDPNYTYELGKQIDSDLADVLIANPRISTTQATILVAMEYLDENKKAGVSTSQLRAQIKDYLDDASNAKSKADFARREAEKAKKEVEVLRAENTRLKAQLADILNKMDNN